MSQEPSAQIAQTTRRFWKKLLLGGALCFCMFGCLVWICLFRDVPLEISPETTYITEPLTPDGKQVDYFRALELEFESPDMATNKNGYRIIIQALGLPVRYYGDQAYVTEQFHKKLKIDTSTPPTMKFEDPYDFIDRYVTNLPPKVLNPAASENMEELPAESMSAGMPGMESMEWGQPDPAEEKKKELEAKITQPWTAEELPIMADWLKANNPVLDLITKAIQQPCFCMPLIKLEDQYHLMEFLLLRDYRLTSLGQALQVRANYRIGSGDLDRAIDDILSCKALGRHISLSRDPSLTPAHHGMDLEVEANYVPIAGCRQHQPTITQLQRLLDGITGNTLPKLPPRLSCEQMFLLRRYHVLDGIQTLAKETISKRDEIINSYQCMDMPCKFSYFTSHLGLNWNSIAKEANQAYDNPESFIDLNTSGYLPRTKLLLPSNRTKILGNILIGFLSDFHFGGRYLSTAINKTESCNRLQAITLAMLIYEKEHGHLPPAWIVDSHGKPLHSWRVLLLPYLGKEAKELYKKIRLDEPWDSKHNRQFHQTNVPLYQIPNNKMAPGDTCYSVVVGPKTAFRGPKGVKPNELGPYLANLILVVERASPVCWMNPSVELTPKKLADEISNNKEYPEQHFFGFHCGSVRFIKDYFAKEKYKLNSPRIPGMDIDVQMSMMGQDCTPTFTNLYQLLEGNMEKIPDQRFIGQGLP